MTGKITISLFESRVSEPHFLFLADPDPGKNLLEDPDPDLDPVILIMIPEV